MNVTKAEYLPIDKLHPFEDHPFQVKDDDQMEQLVWSILSQGILTPIIVRPMGDEYEVVSGHRRVHACKKAGIAEVPALIYCLDRDEAAIALVDSNLHREHILPSEKAFAYKMRLEAMKRQGERTDLTSAPLVRKFSEAREQIGNEAGESREQVRRYIRLTELIPGILELVDEGKIGLRPAVELSYIPKDIQEYIFDTMDMEQCTPTHAQARRMRALSEENKLTEEVIEVILMEEKPNQKEKIVLRGERFRDLFPKNLPLSKREDYVAAAMEHYGRYLARREREMER